MNDYMLKVFYNEVVVFELVSSLDSCLDKVSEMVNSAHTLRTIVNPVGLDYCITEVLK